MATTTTATTNFSSTVTAEVKRRVLENLRARFVHAGPYAGPIPGSYVKGTNSFTYTTYPDLAASTTALTEGTAPTAAALSISVDSFSATQIGATIEISDLAALQSPHNLLEVASDRAAFQAALSMDTMVRDIIAAGTSVIYSSGAARSTLAASNVITGALVKRMVEELTTANIEPFDDGTFHAVIHPRVAGDLQRDTASGGYVDVFKYDNAEGLQGFRTANYAGVRFFVTSQAKVFATSGASSANVYGTLFLGPRAFAMNDIQTLQAYLVGPGGDHTDPLAQKAIVGWKVMFGTKLLTGPGTKIWRLESGATYG